MMEVPLARWSEFEAQAPEIADAGKKLFYQFGPTRNRSLRDHHFYEDETIAQDELDDLLVLMPRSHRPETAASTPS